MFALQNYGKNEPVYDGSAYTIVASYHAASSDLYFYTTHPFRSSSGRLEFQVNQVCKITLEDDVAALNRGMSALLNARDFCKQQRDYWINNANAIANSGSVHQTAPWSAAWLRAMKMHGKGTDKQSSSSSRTEHRASNKSLLPKPQPQSSSHAWGLAGQLQPPVIGQQMSSHGTHSVGNGTGYSGQSSGGYQQAQSYPQPSSSNLQSIPNQAPPSSYGYPNPKNSLPPAGSAQNPQRQVRPTSFGGPTSGLQTSTVTPQGQPTQPRSAYANNLQSTNTSTSSSNHQPSTRTQQPPQSTPRSSYHYPAGNYQNQNHLAQERGVPLTRPQPHSPPSPATTSHSYPPQPRRTSSGHSPTSGGPNASYADYARPSRPGPSNYSS